MVQIIPRADFDLLWAENGMAAKVAMRVFLESSKGSPAKNPKYAGGTSQIVKLETTNGQHIGTIHRIVMPDGSIPHEHPKDYTLRDCSRVRIPEPGP